MKHARLILALGLLTLVSTGCNRTYFTDDIDIEWDFGFLGPDDSLHLPYVVGTKVRISAHRTRDDEIGWWLESSNPSVLRILSQSNGSAECEAVGTGEAIIRAYKSRDARKPERSTTIVVKRPNRTELFAHGPMFVDIPVEAAYVRDPQLRVGGTGTFLVRYFKDDQRLYGNGVLGTASTPEVSYNRDTSFLFENREWLQISPHEAGTHTLPLSVGGVSLPPVKIKAVNDDAVARVELVHQRDKIRENVKTVVLARAFDQNDVEIFGVDFDWALGDVAEESQGDLYYYEYNEDVETVLEASFGDASDAIMVHAEDGYVSTSNVVGCQVGGAPPVVPVVVVLGLFVLGLRRRKRTS